MDQHRVFAFGAGRQKGDRGADQEDIRKRVVSIQEKVFGPTNSKIVPALDELADLYKRRGKDAEAALIYERTVAIYEATHEETLAICPLGVLKDYAVEA